MEDVIDKLRAEMDDLAETQEFRDVIYVGVESKFDDPGLVTMDEYPYIYVAPVSDNPISETMGRAGYDVRALHIHIGVVVNASDYFNPTVSELPASRELVRASALIRKRLRRLFKRGLDGLSGVRDTVIEQTNYVPDLREDVFVRVAVTSIVVERQYQHED